MSRGIARAPFSQMVAGTLATYLGVPRVSRRSDKWYVVPGLVV